MKKWLPSEIESLCIDYGILSKKELEEKYNRKYISIQSSARRFGIRYKFQLHDREEEVVQMYLSGKGTTELEETFNVDQYVIDRILKKNGVIKRNMSESHKKYKINENYFDLIDSEDKAYFLGLLYADGYITKKSNTVGIDLQERDSYILEDLKSHIGYTGPLLQYKFNCENHSDRVRLRFVNKYLHNRVNQLGITSTKTSDKLSIPKEITKELIPHFIRGYFDGDGYVKIVEPIIEKNKNRTVKQVKFQLVGNDHLLNEIHKWLSENCNLPENKNLTSVKHSYVKYLSYNGNTYCWNIYNYIYNQATIFLQRKKEVFENVFRIHPTYKKYFLSRAS